MAVKTKMVKTAVEVYECDRCKKPRNHSAVPFVGTLDGQTITPPEYRVCKKCAEVLKNSLTMVQRTRKGEATKPKAPQPVGAGAGGDI